MAVLRVTRSPDGRITQIAKQFGWRESAMTLGFVAVIALICWGMFSSSLARYGAFGVLRNAQLFVQCGFLIVLCLGAVVHNQSRRGNVVKIADENGVYVQSCSKLGAVPWAALAALNIVPGGLTKMLVAKLNNPDVYRAKLEAKDTALPRTTDFQRFWLVSQASIERTRQSMARAAIARLPFVILDRSISVDLVALRAVLIEFRAQEFAKAQQRYEAAQYERARLGEAMTAGQASRAA